MALDKFLSGFFDHFVGTMLTVLGSYLWRRIVPSSSILMACSMTGNGRRNHSCGLYGFPNRSLISMSSLAPAKKRWIRVSNLPAGGLGGEVNLDEAEDERLGIERSFHKLLQLGFDLGDVHLVDL